MVISDVADDPGAGNGYRNRSVGGASADAACGRDILHHSRFCAIKLMFGHLRPGDWNVCATLSPILWISDGPVFRRGVLSCATHDRRSNHRYLPPTPGGQHHRL